MKTKQPLTHPNPPFEKGREFKLLPFYKGEGWGGVWFFVKLLNKYIAI
ncbi:MAG: hypothetical protein V3V16_13440 [Melioribacteraceae bacterium]